MGDGEMLDKHRRGYRGGSTKGVGVCSNLPHAHKASELHRATASAACSRVVSRIAGDRLLADSTASDRRRRAHGTAPCTPPHRCPRGSTRRRPPSNRADFRAATRYRDSRDGQKQDKRRMETLAHDAATCPRALLPSTTAEAAAIPGVEGRALTPTTRRPSASPGHPLFSLCWG